MILKSLRFILRFLLILISVLLLLISLPYPTAYVYDFEEPVPFSGRNWHNPYQDTTGSWQKSVFHAHSKAWGGLTNGKLTAEEFTAHYDSLGYDVIGLSNYHLITRHIADPEVFIPIYEHGYNVMKRHQGAIGAKEVVWKDFLLIQTLHHKQSMLQFLRPTTEFIAINHPKFVNGYEPEDFRVLGGYDFIEVLNHYRISDLHWDYALANGKKVWGIGNDDSHNQWKENESGRYWTMVRAASNKRADIFASLRAGKMYSVSGSKAKLTIHPTRIEVRNDSLFVETDTIANVFHFINAPGNIADSVTNSNSAAYALKQNDTYVRIVIKNDANTLYLNPVIRYDEVIPDPPRIPEVNSSLTWLYRFLWVLVYAAIIWVIYRRFFKKRSEVA